MLSEDQKWVIFERVGLGLFFLKDSTRECMYERSVKAFASAIESAACAERDARIAELEAEVKALTQDREVLALEGNRLTQQLAEARKDAERLTNEQIDAGIKAWFSTDITINEGKDRGHPFRQRMRAAIRAAIKEQT